MDKIEELERAKKLVEEEENKAYQACAKEYKEACDVVLKKHGFDAVIFGEFKGGAIRTGVTFVKWRK